MAKPVLIIMCGLPFSGKTFLAKMISEQLSCDYVGFDDVWLELAGCEPHSVTATIVEKAVVQRITAASGDARSAIYDTLHCTRSWRDSSTFLASSLGFAPQIVYMNTPVELIRKRYQENALTPTRHHINEETLNLEIGKFEPPAAPESYFEYTPDLSVQDFISALQADT